MSLRRAPLLIPSLGIPRRAAGLLVATVLALALGITSPAARTALAADPLEISADATYTLDPEASSVHVAIDFRVTNPNPNDASFVYFYRDIGIPIQPEARSVRASDGSGQLSIPTQQRDGYVEATIHLRSNLYYRETAAFTIRYDLVGGAPRSDSPVRVGAAFATFGVWAWGDPLSSTVEVHTPPGFGSQVDGSMMQLVTATSGQTLKASPPQPDTFFAIVSSENRSAYRSTRVSLGSGVTIVVLAWPEDGAWNSTVSQALRKGMPQLRKLIGLDWPVEHDLSIRERFTPALEGYAGVFFTEDQRIDVGEELDPTVILHETSHAWFNSDLFSERWIYEGLAEEYAWRVQKSVGGESGPGAERPDRDDPGRVSLGGWTFPQVIRDEETDDRERYGYQAAFWVIHQFVTAAGVERMRDAFVAADNDTTAYVGAGAPETVASSDGWKRLLDLVQSFEQRSDSTAIEQALEDFVIRGNDVRALHDRREAREDYRALLEAGDGWLPPWYVRKPMGEWRFDTATPAMAHATAALDLRDDVLAAADGLGLEPDDALKTAYESAQEGFAGATAIGEQQLAALDAIADAKTKLEAPQDLLASLGLMGERPAVPYEAARSAFGQGQLEQALTSAEASAAIIVGAPAVGQQRLIIGVAISVVVLLVLVALTVALRRRRRDRRALAVAAVAPAFIGPTLDIDGWRLDAAGPQFDPAGPTLDGALPVVAAPDAEPPVLSPSAATEPYATLAADPGASPSPMSADPPDLEGGRSSGELPADR